jgi:hypothetical protein
MRKKKEIAEEMNIACDKVWYDRHQWAMENEYPKEKDPGRIRCIRGGIKAAKKMEKKYGKKNLGPYSKFEWGMLNGRLETLRWVLGDDWGNMDT